MRHLTIVHYGSFLGITSNRLVVSENGDVKFEIPLSRLRTIKIAKKGISLSSDLIQACAARGIRIFFLDFRGVATAAISGNNQHAVVEVRRRQFEFVNSTKAHVIARELISTKILNQRNVLLYFSKYISKTSPSNSEILKTATASLDEIRDRISLDRHFQNDNWREVLMGFEGAAAVAYWKALEQCQLLPATFVAREGRGSAEIGNAALNFGYAILLSSCWSALENAGVELYAGILHSSKPGKPSLVLDFMEEYRAWVVDRIIIKIRKRLSHNSFLSKELKTLISDEIHNTLASKISYRGKTLSLETIMQRQAYRLVGAMLEDSKKYRGLHFKW